MDDLPTNFAGGPILCHMLFCMHACMLPLDISSLASKMLVNTLKGYPEKGVGIKQSPAEGVGLMRHMPAKGVGISDGGCLLEGKVHRYQGV
jgi:hypothetical protein